GCIALCLPRRMRDVMGSPVLKLSPNVRGALFMSISMAGFTLNDVFVKAVSANMNMGQVMFVRGVFATAFLLLIAWHQGALTGLATIFRPLVWVRMAGELGGTLFYLIALANPPLANVSAVFQALPLTITLAAVLFLGERVGWRRWLTMIAGFGGILIIVRPGFEGFAVHSIFILICVVFCALRDLATSRIPDTISSLQLSIVTAFVI